MLYARVITSRVVTHHTQVDVFSVGVIFYQMLFGRRPFGEGLSQEAIMREGVMRNAREVRALEMCSHAYANPYIPAWAALKVLRLAAMQGWHSMPASMFAGRLPEQAGCKRRGEGIHSEMPCSLASRPLGCVDSSTGEANKWHVQARMRHALARQGVVNRPVVM